MINYPDKNNALIVTPVFEAPAAEDTNARLMVINALGLDGNPVSEPVAFQVRVSESITGLSDAYGKYSGVIGAASDEATISAHTNAAFGSLLTGTGSATVTMRTNNAGYCGIKVTYTGVGTIYTGVGPADFGSTLIVGDNVAVLTFA